MPGQRRGVIDRAEAPDSLERAAHRFGCWLTRHSALADAKLQLITGHTQPAYVRTGPTKSFLSVQFPDGTGFWPLEMVPPHSCGEYSNLR